MAQIIETYSKLASTYESEENLGSCWGKATQHAMALLSVRQGIEVVVEVGCGPGIQLASLIESSANNLQFIGIEPADNLRNNAIERTKKYSNSRVLNGRFEELPLQSHSVDYLYSLIAFHWVTDVEKAVAEIARVLKEDGEIDIIFSGRHTGKEFISKTSPIFFKHLSPRQIIDAAMSRQRLTVAATEAAFRPLFGSRNLSVSESYHTYFDTLERHWSWWCRIEGQFSGVPPEIKAECDCAVKEAIASLDSENGIPYTIHLIHVRVRR
jgi:ubiquinone/menaquinone biosynthesis C-methylase UbiE